MIGKGVQERQGGALAGRGKERNTAGEREKG